MCGKHRTRARRLQRLAKREAVLAHQHPDSLQREESGMALVHMAHRRLHPHRVERAQPANAKHDFLTDPGFFVSPVQLIGDVLHVLGVLRHVRVEQEQREPTDNNLPDLNRCELAGEVNLYLQWLPIRPQHGLERHVVEVVCRVVLLLPAVVRQVLTEVTLLIEQANADEGHTEIARSLEMVAGKYAEATGVNRQAFSEAVFGGEVRDQRP
jgi:hypothetical protein